MPGIIGSVLGLVSLVSVYCDWVRWKVWFATSISVWQYVKLSRFVPEIHSHVAGRFCNLQTNSVTVCLAPVQMCHCILWHLCVAVCLAPVQLCPCCCGSVAVPQFIALCPQCITVSSFFHRVWMCCESSLCIRLWSQWLWLQCVTVCLTIAIMVIVMISPCVCQWPLCVTLRYVPTCHMCPTMPVMPPSCHHVCDAHDAHYHNVVPVPCVSQLPCPCALVTLPPMCHAVYGQDNVPLSVLFFVPPYQRQRRVQR